VACTHQPQAAVAFPGFANFYRRFIRNYSRVAAPLIALISIALRWTPEVETTFIELKHWFCSTPVLVQPDTGSQFTVEVDASDTGVGAVLSQRSPPDSKLNSCTFFTWKRSPAERNYVVGNCEVLAIVLLLEEWCHWFEGAFQPFIIWTDHRNLIFLQSFLHQSRWVLFLGHFNFTLSYRPGSRNIKPDVLSRISTTFNSYLAPILPPSCFVTTVTWEIESQVRQAQALQPDPDNGPPNSLFVPASVQSQVLQWAHSTHITSHPGSPGHSHSSVNASSHPLWTLTPGPSSPVLPVPVKIPPPRPAPGHSVLYLYPTVPGHTLPWFL